MEVKSSHACAHSQTHCIGVSSMTPFRSDFAFLWELGGLAMNFVYNSFYKHSLSLAVFGSFHPWVVGRSISKSIFWSIINKWLHGGCYRIQRRKASLWAGGAGAGPLQVGRWAGPWRVGVSGQHWERHFPHGHWSQSGVEALSYAGWIPGVNNIYSSWNCFLKSKTFLAFR